ncbi:MAG: potassium channel family protein [Nanoarchaeota archaeon]
MFKRLFQRRILNLDKTIDEWHQRKVATWIDRVTFIHILVVWASIIVLFGLFYYYFADGTNYLYYNLKQLPVKDILDSIYFSFITATSTGFGDVLPSGVFKIISIVEVVFGLLLLAFVTSKLISIKQDAILNEIYDISFQERINRLRSTLLLFRQHLSRLISKIEDRSIQKREIQEVYVYISQFEDTLNEIVSLLDRDRKHQFTKEINPVSAELILNSITSSLEKLREFLVLSNQQQQEWKRDVTMTVLHRCLAVNETVFGKMSSALPEKRIADLGARNRKVVEGIRKEMGG